MKENAEHFKVPHVEVNVPEENGGLIFVYTREGCGRCTATMGHALRVVAAGQCWFIAQFDRCGWDPVLTILHRISGTFVYRQYTDGETTPGGPDPKDIRGVRASLAEVDQALRSGDYSLVILEGVNRAVCFGLYSVADFLDLIDQKPEHVQLVITGACADPRILQRADQVIEMHEMKQNSETFSLIRHRKQNV